MKKSRIGREIHITYTRKEQLNDFRDLKTERTGVMPSKGVYCPICERSFLSGKSAHHCSHHLAMR
jgi:hypothetical protein